MRRSLALSMAVLALGLVAAGCGDDDDDEGGDGAATPTQPAPAPAETETAPAGGEELTLSSPADGSLEFDKTEITAPAGEVTIDYENQSADVPHNVTIEGTDAATETIMGDTTSLTTELEPGEYTFFCSVGQHRQAGMEGTLTVE